EGHLAFVKWQPVESGTILRHERLQSVHATVTLEELRQERECNRSIEDSGTASVALLRSTSVRSTVRAQEKFGVARKHGGDNGVPINRRLSNWFAKQVRTQFVTNHVIQCQH